MRREEQSRTVRVEAWLAGGGLVLASSERAARAVVRAYDAARRAEGRTAWASAAVIAWDGWVRAQWTERNTRGLVLLNPLQEQALWGRVIRESRAELLRAERLATAAMRAYGLVCDFAPEALRAGARTGWLDDAAEFSEWMDGFEVLCRREGLISGSRLALDLVGRLRGERNGAPLLLIGFDRLLATQVALLDAWGPWELERRDEGADSKAGGFVVARDGAAEIAACVAWVRSELRANPEARLMVVVPGLAERRGELERAMLSEPGLDFEFSLGVPLGRVGMVRSALLLLRWMVEPLTEPEVDWLLTSGYAAASREEEIGLAEAMLRLRGRGLERPEWDLEKFAEPERQDCAPPAAWVGRMQAARELLGQAAERQSAMEWAGLAGSVLEAMGWPGFRPASSVSYQARRRWEAVLEDCGSLGFDGGRMDWAEFVGTLGSAVAETIFATESAEARVQITEPLVSAGQMADGIWFLGADEQNWPGRGQPHPLLPIGLQREAGMPHASPMGDWELAREATARLMDAADAVFFSYARMVGEAEMRPSRLVAKMVAVPEELVLQEALVREPITEEFLDGSTIPYRLAEVSGGAGTLTLQSLCPFQAFATARLGTTDWESAETGLNPKQRGTLLHEVLHRVWGKRAKGGIRSQRDLLGIGDLRAFVGRIAGDVMRESFLPAERNALPARFPERYLELERERLTGLVTEWLEYERMRLPFSVADTEAKGEVTVAGLTLQVRLDRVDVLENGSRLIVDYKSGETGPKAWDGERPDDVQLPLYAVFGVKEDLEGLVFGRVRPGDTRFLGRVRSAGASLLPDLHAMNALVRNPLTDGQMEEWRGRIERLGEDFVAGRAEVDPKDRVKVCGNCGLQAVCRIYEHEPLADSIAGEDELDGVGGGDD